MDQERGSNMVICFGSPLLDIIAEVSETFLKIHNLQVNGAKHLTDKSFFKTALAMDHETEIGGSVTNTVRVLQAILSCRNAVTYVGAIGDDLDGRTLKERLEEESVRCLFKKQAEVPTGRCAVLVNGENRSLCTDLGASKLYSLEDLENSQVQENLQSAKCIYLSAFFLEVSIECVMRIVRFKKKIVAFNIGAAFLCEKHPEAILEAVKYADLIFGNDSEAHALAEIMKLNCGDIKIVGAGISKNEMCNESQHRIVVITRGAQSVIVASKEGVKEYEVGRLKNNEVIDTNGAGDAFAGGFLAKYLQGNSIDDAVKCGIIAAQEIIRNVGCCFNPEQLCHICQ